MTPEQWQIVTRLFEAALLVPEAERGDLLRRECDESAILHEVERLLAIDSNASGQDFLRPPISTELASQLVLLNPHMEANQGLHFHCPHCHEPIELLASRPAKNVTCQLCGSTFRVEDEEEPTDWPEGKPGNFGRFRLDERLGEGSFGSVYKAYDPKLERFVALKVPRLANLRLAADREAFYREARASARLRHPSIVRVFEVDEVEGTVYIVSDYIEGMTLAERLAEPETRPGFPEITRIMIALAEALHFAHENGVVHRDIKPSNVMLDSDGKPLVMDFGLAKRDATEITITLTGRPLGTPAFMSPEQARGEGAQSDARSDVYSMGVVLYQMLTGELPFRGTERMIVQRVLNDDPRPPRTLNDRIPIDLETICLKAMEKDPARRFQSAREFAEELTLHQDNKPLRIRPIGPAERCLRWCRRNPWLATAIIATAASLCCVAFVSVLLAIKSQRMLDDSNRHHASMRFNLGREACERGELGIGLVWMEHCLAAAIEAGDADWSRVARANLVAWSHIHRPLLKVIPHEGEVKSGAFSPDGTLLVTICSDGSARVWDLAGQPIGQPLQHKDRIFLAQFSPDGTSIVTASRDMTVRFWNTLTSQAQGEPLQLASPITAARMSSDGKLIVTADEANVVQLWNVATRKIQGESLPHADYVWTTSFSPDSSIVLTAGEEHVVRLWDVATGRLLQSLPQEGLVWSAAFSLDGKTLLTGSDKNVGQLWDITTGLARGAPLAHSGVVASVMFSPDGKTILTASWDHSARLWETATSRPIGEPCMHLGAVNTAVFSPDGKTILTASSDRTARLWNATSGESLLPRVHAQGSSLAEALSADGERIVVGTSGGAVSVFNTATGQEVGVPILHGGMVCSVGLSPHGNMAVSGNLEGQARLWKVDTGVAIGAPLVFADRVTVVRFSPDGTVVLITSADGTAQLRDTANFQLIGLPLQHDGSITTAAFWANGRKVATGGEDKTVRIWESTTGKPVLPPLQHPDVVMSVTTSLDGQSLLTSCKDGKARLWNASTGIARSKTLNHDGIVVAGLFSPDGKTVLTASMDGTARLWNVSEKEPQILRILVHQAGVVGLAFDPAGRFVVTASSDGTTRLWDANLGLPIGPVLKHPIRLRNVALSRDAQSILTGSYDDTARLWDLSYLAGESGNIERLTGLKMNDRGEIVPSVLAVGLGGKKQ